MAVGGSGGGGGGGVISGAVWKCKLCTSSEY